MARRTALSGRWPVDALSRTAPPPRQDLLEVAFDLRNETREERLLGQRRRGRKVRLRAARQEAKKGNGKLSHEDEGGSSVVEGQV